MLLCLSDVMQDWVFYTVVIKGRARSLKEANIKCEQLKEKESALTLHEEEHDFKVAESRAANDIKQAQLRAMSAHVKAKICNSQTDTEFTESSKQCNNFKKIKLNRIHNKSPTLIKSENSEYGDRKNNIVVDKLNAIVVEIKQLKHDSDYIKN